MGTRGVNFNGYDVWVVRSGFPENAVIHHVLNRYSVVVCWSNVVYQIRLITMEEKKMHQCHQALAAKDRHCPRGRDLLALRVFPPPARRGDHRKEKNAMLKRFRGFALIMALAMLGVVSPLSDAWACDPCPSPTERK